MEKDKELLKLEIKKLKLQKEIEMIKRGKYDRINLEQLNNFDLKSNQIKK